MILHPEKGIHVVSEATNGLQTIDVVSDLKPDVVLLRIITPEIDGIQIIPPLREKSPKTKVLMFTSFMDEAAILKALKVGAKGYLPKDSSVSDLVKAIQAVHEGELWIERKLMSRLFDNEAAAASIERNPRGRTKEGLTQREQEVLRLLSKGLTNKEIAQDLFISENTIKCHLNSVFKKLKVTRRLQAILYATKKGLN
jgi:two-component system NarL family response regulator